MESRLERIRNQIGAVALTLIVFVDGKLAEHGHRIGTVALLRFWQEGALDLRGAERDIADDSAGRRVGDDGDAGGALA